MMKAVREFRVIPVVLFASICLLTLKVIGILRGEGYVLTDEPYLADTLATRIADSREPKPLQTAEGKPQPRSQSKSQSWAQEMFNYPDVTGSVPETKSDVPKPQIATKKPADPPKQPDGTLVNLDTNQPASPAERALL